MNTGRRRSAKGKWQDAMFPVKWPKYAGERDTGSPQPSPTIDCRAGRPALESERRFAKKTEATMARVFVKT